METPEPAPEKKNKFYLITLPVILIVVTVVFAIAARTLKPKPEKQEVKATLPVVEVITARSERIQLKVIAEGNVQARTETNLFAEASGRIQKVSPAFVAGGFFQEGDVLVEIDPVDYHANLATARSRVAEAHVTYEQERAQAEQAKEDWANMNKGEPNELVLRIPQLTRAKAQIDAANAALSIAMRDLERTRIKAPYDGRVKEKFVDVGQTVNARNTSLAFIYATDIAEVRLPLSVNDIGYLELPEDYRNDSTAKPKPSVTLKTNYAGETFSWNGAIVRTEGTIDPKTRLTYVVAQVQDPYGKSDEDSDAPPLKIGMYVQAEILGKEIENAFELPIQALRPNKQMLVIDGSRTATLRDVTVVKENVDSVIVSAGLEDGDLVCTTPLQYVVDGMKVVIDGDEIEDTDTSAELSKDSER